MTLPPHVATADEAIPALDNDRCAGPDMHAVQPIDVMLAALHQLEHDDYLDCWLTFLTSIGGTAYAEYDRAGEVRLSVGLPCDSQMRHRSRWAYFLAQDLDRREGRRGDLIYRQTKAGWLIDMRSRDPRATTSAIREYVHAGGRILISPNGTVEEGSLPRQLTDGSAEEADRCLRASRNYLGIRKQFRADQQIRRAEQMLGKKTPNGWWVVEADRG